MTGNFRILAKALHGNRVILLLIFNTLACLYQRYLHAEVLKIELQNNPINIFKHLSSATPPVFLHVKYSINVLKCLLMLSVTFYSVVVMAVS